MSGAARPSRYHTALRHARNDGSKYHNAYENEKALVRELIKDLEEVSLLPGPPYFDGDKELQDAWHSLQLHWLHSIPGYREEIRSRVSAVAIKADILAKKIETGHKDVDYLGMEVEGCG